MLLKYNNIFKVGLLRLIMGFPKIEGFGFKDEGAGHIVGYDESSCFEEGCFKIDFDTSIPLDEIDCFYASPSKREGTFNVKIFYKDTSVESFGRTDNHERAKEWVEMGNGLLKKVG